MIFKKYKISLYKIYTKMFCSSNTSNGSQCKKLSVSQGLCEKHQPKCDSLTFNGFKCKRKVKIGELCQQHKLKIQKNKPVYNIVIFGKGGTGKTSYMKSLQNEKFDNRYIADWGITNSIIELENTILKIQVLPGQRLHEVYDFSDIDAVIVFVTAEVTPLFSKETLTNFNKINKKYNLPVIVVNNVFGSYINRKSKNILKTTLPLFDINVEKNEKLMEPLEYLVNMLN